MLDALIWKVVREELHRKLGLARKRRDFLELIVVEVWPVCSVEPEPHEKDGTANACVSDVIQLAKIDVMFHAICHYGLPKIVCCECGVWRGGTRAGVTPRC
jgi:hypothetical protein